MNKRIYFIVGLLCLLFTSSCADFDSLINQRDMHFFKPESQLENGLFHRRYSEDNALKLAPLVYFVVDFEDPISVRYFQTIRKICDYTKLPFASISIKKWNANPVLPESVRVVTMSKTSKLSDESVAQYYKFVAEGGMLFISSVNEDLRFNFLLGKKLGAEGKMNLTAKGIKFTNHYLPSLQNTSIYSEQLLYGLEGENFSDQVKILATASNNSSVPAIIEHEVGAGKVINFNTGLDFNKVDRGLFFASILRGLEGVPYPIVNTSTIFLDDFPSPIYETKLEPIKSEMNLSISDFVYKVWWPDMLQLANKYNIKYCTVAAFDYKNNITPPFLFNQWDAVKIKDKNQNEVMSSWFMRDAFKKGHELGLHGFNHVSLTKKDWKNEDFMSTALEGVIKKWRANNFGHLPISYVPPSNIIDATGLKQLKIGMPSLKYMCSLYLGEIAEGGGREFDFDPLHPELFDYPRISSGFYIAEESHYVIQSQFLYTGIWNHFVHPDDVFQVPSPFNKSAGAYELRNGKEYGWRKSKNSETSLLKEFDKLLSQQVKLYPGLRFIDANKGATETLEWRANQFSHVSSDSYYKVEKLVTSETLFEYQYWMLYASDEEKGKIETSLNKEAIHFTKTPFQEGYLYFIYTTNGALRLPKLNNNNSKGSFVQVMKSYNQYMFEHQKLVRGEGSEYSTIPWEQLVKLEKSELWNRMQESADVDYGVWNRYAEIASWEQSGEEMWDLLSEVCRKKASEQNVMYSQVLATKIWYRTEHEMIKWLQAQLLFQQSNPTFLKAYVDQMNSPENQENIGYVLEQLLSVEESEQNYMAYLTHLVYYDHDKALEELETIEPSSTYESIATSITWLYADHHRYDKAYDWSFYAQDVDVISKIYWLAKENDLPAIELLYNEHMQQNPKDEKLKAYMAQLYYGMGHFKEAWILGDGLLETKEKDALRRAMNKDVIYIDNDLKHYLMTYHPSFYLPQVLEQERINHRIRFGNFAETENEMNTNRTRNVLFSTLNSYNLYDKHKNRHKVGFVYNELYKLNFLEANSNEELNQLNVFKNVFGIEYKFMNPIDYTTWQWYVLGRIETDREEVYYHLGSGVSKSFENSYSSLGVRWAPAETTAAYSLGIYEMKLNAYQSLFWLKNLESSLSLEGSYFSSNTMLNQLTSVDEQMSGSLTLKTAWNNRLHLKHRLIPYAEGSISKGSTTYGNGFPYWMLESRTYAGGGLGWKKGTEIDRLEWVVDASYFWDDYAEAFQRFTGTLKWKVVPHFVINGQWEMYNQSRFYSNNFKFGAVYYFNTAK